MVITIWKRGAVSSGSLYGNGDSPFPYGDVSIPVSKWRSHMETGNHFIQLPIWKRGSPYGNGDFQGICKSPFPYGDHHNHMETGTVSRESGKILISCPKFGGRCSSMRDLEVAKNTLPISIRGVPVRGQGESNIPIWGVPVSE
jgi:hypothetical protein